MAYIVETIAGDKRIQLGNEDFVRPMGFGANWKKIRIAMRLAFNDSGSDITTAGFVVGVCQGTQYSYSSANCIDFIGASIPGGATPDTISLTRTTSTILYYTSPGNSSGMAVHKKVGAVITAVSYGLNVTGYFNAVPTAYRSLYFVDIAKGSPNYAINTWTQSQHQSDFSRDTYISMLDNESAPTPLASSAATPAYSGSGLFDSVCIRWNKSTPTIEISDLTVVRFY
jgi:hypothetical protein